MAKCSLDIKKDIIDTVGKKMSNLGATVEGNVGFFPNPSRSSNAINSINKEFGSLVVQAGEQGSFFIEPSDALIKEYLDEYNRSLPAEDLNLQLEGTEGSKASPETIAKIKKAAKKMGISIQDLVDYAKAAKLDTRSINGVADLVRGVIAVSSGREDTVLTEEMVHLATAILEQTNPALVTSMISKIDRFQIYKKTLAEYSGNKNYQLPNGKPDIRKIKKEAVDRLIAEVIINQNEGDTEFPELMEETNRSMVQKLWETIKDYIKGIYGKTNIDIFQEAARQIIGEEAIGTVADIQGGGVFYQLKNDLVDNYYNKIMDVDSKVVGPIPEAIVNGVKVKRHYLFDGVKVLQTVTEKIKQKIGKSFGNRTDLQKKMDDFKKNWGTEGHNFIQNYITNNLIDKDGYARKDFLDVKISTKLNETIQDALKGFSEELIRSYAPGTRFIIEKRVVNQKVKGMIASTVDFKAIEPVEINGKKDIRIDTLDWKFTGLDPSNKDDIPWYKQTEWKEQMGEYTKIDYSYGAKPEQIRKTRMIPFIANYKYNIPGDSNSGLNLDNIEVGKLDSLQETRTYLLPVALNTESTGNAEIDRLLKSLRTQYEKLYKKSVSPQEKFAKTLQLNEMSRAIRSLHMKLDFAPLAAVGKTFLESAAKAFKSFENVDYSKLTVEDINKKLGSLLEFKNSAEKFEKLDAIFRTNFSDKEMTTEDKNVLASIEKVASSARRMKDEISKLQSAYVVQLGLIQGLTREETKLSVLNAQREVKGIFKSFAEASKIPNHLIRLSANLWMNAKSLVSQKIARDITDFGELLNPLEKEASAKGKSAFDLIGRVEDDGLYLIQKLSKKFMADVALAKEEQNKKFLLANIDIDLYNKLAKERIDKGIEEFQNTEFSTNEQQDYEIRESKINKLKDLLDINRDSFNGYNDYEFSELFSETLIEKNHYSSEYKEMAQSKAALDVWNLFTAMNKKAKQMGYLSQQGLSFFPLMEASALQKLSQTNDFVGQGFDFFRDAYTVKVNEEQSFSKTDPETGKVKKQIPKLFTRTDKNVSQLSRDLNRVGTLWIKSLAEYENRKNTEHILLTLLSVERAKPQIAIDAATGETIWEGGVPQTIEGGENKNADLLEAIINDYLYGLREDASSMGNVAIGTVTKKLSNDEETSEKRALAAKKVLQNGDKLTQSLAVGLKLLVTIPNYIGVNMQAFINAGNFYTFSEFTKNNVKLQVQMSTIEKGLIDLIVPLNEDITKEKGRELAWKQSPVKWLGTWTFNDVMMVTNSFPEKKLQIAAAMSMNDNSMVVNGKIVNIRQYLKKQDEARYKKDASGKYIMSESERRALEKTFESRVKELKATSALAKIAKIENGYVVIPGVSSEELAKYRTMIVENIRNLNGQMSEENKANYRRDTIFKSFMMFKNWIPKQVGLRTGDINKNLELNQWEYGRTRLFVKTWAQLGFRNIFKMQAILQGTDEGLAIMDEMLKAKKEEHFKRTGEELDITDEEFYDMVRRELSNQMKELGVLLGVMALLIAAKVAPPPDDKDKLATNRFKYFLKLINKISDEIKFYYDPRSFESMTKGSVLPALGLLTRAGQFIGALEEETRGIIIGDQELQDKNHPLKYFLNMIPIGSQFQNDYLPYLAPDLAKENGIRVSPEARR